MPGRSSLRAGAALAACLSVLAGCEQEGEAPAPVAEETAPAGEAVPAARPTVPIKLYVLDCGRIRVADAAPFSDEHAYDGQARDLVDPCYLIRHPTGGDLMWDTGLPGVLHDAPQGMSRPPFSMTVPVKLTDQLQQLGLAPADIEFVSVSHSHSDHVGNLELFKTATWIVDKDERDWMFRPEARASEEFAAYDAMETARTVLIEGGAEHDVFGDGSVVIHQAPGHTPGHTVLLAGLPGYGPALLSGDLYHLAEAREKRTVPAFNTDRAQTLASMEKVEELARAHGAKVIRQHTPEDFEATPKFPTPAE